MITVDKRGPRDKRHYRLRRWVRGTAAKPRLAVFRSLNHIYAQIVDDDTGRTLAAADSRSKEFRAANPKGGNVAAAKAVERAKKDLIFVALKETTIPFEITGHFGAGRVFLKPAVQGTGVIAGGAVRPVLEAAGIQDILTKTLGTNNPHNVLKATIDALRRIKRLQDLHAARRRGGEGSLVEETVGAKQEA